jgi:hypothetical protein
LRSCLRLSSICPIIRRPQASSVRRRIGREQYTLSLGRLSL